MKSLVLAEKPSVGREIARVLGCNQSHKNYIEGKHYVVTWALGHLIELKMPEHYDSKYKQWKLEDLPIIPEKMGIKVMKQTSHQFKTVEHLSKRNDVGDFIIATDAGREGELVARWILEKIKWKKPIHRLWISSVTDRAIQQGFKNLKPGKDFLNLYDSAVCRAEADWLIGLNISRALTTKYQEPLSAGRVQTPTLSLIMDREKQIQKFIPQEYWLIHAKVGGLQTEWENNGEKRIFNSDKAESIKKQTAKVKATVQSITRKERSESQPLPYDLTELQRDANKKFGFSAKKTSSVLQKLYEQHKIVTYPRTDSRYLTSDMESTMVERLEAIAGAYSTEVKPLLAKKGKVLAKKVFNNSKVTDHHAIIPTEQRVHLSDLSTDEKKLFDLITKRFLALFYPPYQYESVQFKLDIAGETFVAKETHIIDLGFKTLHSSTNEQSSKTALNQLQQGKQLQVHAVEMDKKLTEPPARLSEADLLQGMEKFGLGTPATRAEIIERLISSEVVERQNGRFHSTQKGKQLMELVNDELTSPALTAKWEKELEAIAHGKAKRDDFLKKIRQQTKQIVSEVKKSDKSYRAHNLTGSKCPECGSFLKERNTKEGKVLVCSSLDCNFRKRKDPKLSNRRCPQCHKKMEIHNGKAGTYFQCRKCNVVEKATDKKQKVNKREERKLVQKYSANNDQFGTSLGDLLKQAMEDKE